MTYRPWQCTYDNVIEQECVFVLVLRPPIPDSLEIWSYFFVKGGKPECIYLKKNPLSKDQNELHIGSIFNPESQF